MSKQRSGLRISALTFRVNKTRLRNNTIMDDIFYMSSKDVSIKDINEMAKRMNVKNTFMSKTSGVLEIEYSDRVVASWFCMRLEDFQEVEDKKFLIENRIKSIFCVSHHSINFLFILPHVKADIRNPLRCLLITS